MKLPRVGPRRGLGRVLEALVWLGLVLFVGRRIWPQVAAAFGVASANAAVPAFQLTTLDGTAVSSESLRGQVVLVNFWATWCPPCRVEMPGFQRVYAAKRAQGFTILGVATDAAGRGPVLDFLRERGITYPVAMATGSVVRDFGGANLLPTSFLIDRQGRIRNEVRGVFATLALEQAVDRLLAERPAPEAARSGGSQ
jgi:cytochrome c biogenesis protein CcmG, thiol:disulfide interchange protein DsbE